ncbi:ATP-binding cassette domain-containing protein [Sphingomonas sp. I4]
MSGDLSDVARLACVSKRLGGRSVLAELDLGIRAGEVTALLGPNGAGKTTSVSLLTGRIAPDAGTAEILGSTRADPPRAAAWA